MSKAILVMEMPNSCSKCKMRYIDSYGDACCRLKGFIDSGSDKKPSWCPLRELPNRKPERILKTLGKSVKTTKFEYSDLNIGWNACLDAIEGRTVNDQET